MKRIIHECLRLGLILRYDIEGRHEVQHVEHES